jgi:hypothetical protein
MDHALVAEDPLAPNLIGQHPHDAARHCFERGLELEVENAEWFSSYWGQGQPWHVTSQLPGPGERMTSTTVVARLGLRERPDEAGVREPRRPSPR